MSLTPIGSMESSKDYVKLAQRFYELLNALAPEYTDYDPEIDEPPTPWDELSEGHRLLLAQVFINMIGEGTIR